MFEREITRWQRTQKAMKSAQRQYDNMMPPDPEYDLSDDEIRAMQAKHEAEQEWLIARMEK